MVQNVKSFFIFINSFSLEGIVSTKESRIESEKIMNVFFPSRLANSVLDTFNIFFSVLRDDIKISRHSESSVTFATSLSTNILGETLVDWSLRLPVGLKLARIPRTFTDVSIKHDL